MGTVSRWILVGVLCALALVLGMWATQAGHKRSVAAAGAPEADLNDTAASLFLPLLMRATTLHIRLFLPEVLSIAPPPAPRPTPTPSPPAAFDSATTTVRLERVVRGLTEPVGVVNAGDGSGRLFVVERGGRVLVVKGGVLLAEPFIDLRPIVNTTHSEQGLLGLVFHPDYESNGLFYVNYIDLAGNTRIERYRASSDPDRADLATASLVMAVEQPYQEHNAGDMHFGPDGYLYIALGDGGSFGDPQNRAQFLGTLLGKILRIDVDGAAPYAVPSDNPFVGRSRARPEVWAYGLRNPWRFSFDRLTGDMYIGDVGQDRLEEVDFLPANSRGGENYGWHDMEGTACYVDDCDPRGFVPPVAEYEHGPHCSITGGYVYRGRTQPLWGAYFYADFCSGALWALQRREDETFSVARLDDLPFEPSAFGEDEAGEVYVVGLFDGSLYRLVAAPRS